MACRQETSRAQRRPQGRHCWSSHMPTARVAGSARPARAGPRAVERGVPAAEATHSRTAVLADGKDWETLQGMSCS